VKRVWSVSMFALIGVFGCRMADAAYFRSDARQLEILKKYVANIDCDDAKFSVVEIEDTPFDWGYVFDIQATPACISSLQSGLLKNGYKPGELNSALADQNWLVNTHERGEEIVAFRFDPNKNKVTWLRDKT
jgi:hypothetical protein